MLYSALNVTEAQEIKIFEMCLDTIIDAFNNVCQYVITSARRLCFHYGLSVRRSVPLSVHLSVRLCSRKLLPKLVDGFS